MFFRHDNEFNAYGSQATALKGLQRQVLLRKSQMEEESRGWPDGYCSVEEQHTGEEGNGKSFAFLEILY